MRKQLAVVKQEVLPATTTGTPEVAGMGMGYNISVAVSGKIGSFTGTYAYSTGTLTITTASGNTVTLAANGSQTASVSVQDPTNDLSTTINFTTPGWTTYETSNSLYKGKSVAIIPVAKSFLSNLTSGTTSTSSIGNTTGVHIGTVGNGRITTPLLTVFVTPVSDVLSGTKSASNPFLAGITFYSQDYDPTIRAGHVTDVRLSSVEGLVGGGDISIPVRSHPSYNLPMVASIEFESGYYHLYYDKQYTSLGGVVTSTGTIVYVFVEDNCPVTSITENPSTRTLSVAVLPAYTGFLSTSQNVEVTGQWQATMTTPHVPVQLLLQQVGAVAYFVGDYAINGGG